MGVPPLVVDAPQPSEEERADDQHDDQQDIGQRRGVAGVEVSKAREVDVEGIGLSGHARAPRGEAEGDVQQLEGLHHAQNDHREKHRAQHGECDAAEHLPARGGVKDGRLVDLLGKRLQPRQAHQEAEGGPLPDIHDGDSQPRQPDVGEPLWRVKHAQGFEHGVHRAHVLVEYCQP